MIITGRDFESGKYVIPNVSDRAPDSDLLGNTSRIQQVIDEYVPDALVLTLGYDLFELLKAELDPNEKNGLKSGADPRYDKLLNGDGAYQGLRPILVPFVYFKFLEEDESHYATVGVVQENAKGATRFSPVSKAVKAWRDFYERTIGIDPQPLAWQRTSILGNLTAYDWVGTTGGSWTPLYTYLKENDTVYPEAVMTYFENINYYGI